MKPNIPTLVQGVDYEELKGGKYRFRLLRDVEYRFPELMGPTHKYRFLYAHGLIEFLAGGRVWATFDRGTWVFKKDYAWNGCSPKWWVPILGWLGTPDTAANVHGSLPHDVWFQFLEAEHFPYVMEQVNDLFGYILRMKKAMAADIYDGVVQVLGPRVWKRSGKVWSRVG
jgi:hypothetical protein